MGLDLGVLTSASAQSLTQALVYHERELGEPDPKALRLFADQLEATYDDDNWPFTGDPYRRGGTPPRVRRSRSTGGNALSARELRGLVAGHRRGLARDSPPFER